VAVAFCVWPERLFRPSMVKKLASNPVRHRFESTPLMACTLERRGLSSEGLHERGVLASLRGDSSGADVRDGEEGKVRANQILLLHAGQGHAGQGQGKEKGFKFTANGPLKGAETSLTRPFEDDGMPFNAGRLLPRPVLPVAEVGIDELDRLHYSFGATRLRLRPFRA